MQILILNGPNLNLLGTREPDVYGTQDFQSFFEELAAVYNDVAEFKYYQSNVEGELIDSLQTAEGKFDGVLFNAGGYTHTSVSLMDCISAISAPVVEVHISNPLAREAVRHTSLIGQKCIASVSGFGLDSYRLALEGLLHKLSLSEHNE
ncbi:MAG: 3-dehydroquinate dehydratase [Schleiferiaceae bacterium]|jgi:3-dehydroquinate dehydratase-2|nr:3-dehydroquinate dehydratase [Schleiferiaceae bacterium]